MVINQNLTTINRWVGTNKPEWICLHYTANGKSYKGMAWNNTNYFKSVYREASAHYFVDDKEIWQCVKDTDSSWHCGDAISKNGCTNRNSIGIEICDNNGVFTTSALALATELVKSLMKKYNIPVERVCRHYDVTGKICPADWVRNPSKWDAFRNSLKPVATKPATVTIKANDKVKLTSDAVYYNGVAVPQWVKNKNWIVKSVSGDRVVIDRSADGQNAICSPVNIKYICLVTSAPNTAKTASTSTTTAPVLKVGDTVKLSSNAVYYDGGIIPQWVKNTTLYLRELNGDRAVISTLKTGAVTGAVNKKYLTKV